MPILIEEIDAFNTNENMFCTMDKTTNSSKDLVGRKLYNYYQYPLILMEIANAL